MTKARDLASSTPVPSTVSTTELGYVDGVTSAIQTQMDSKLGTSTAASTYQTKATNGLVLLNTTTFSGVSSQSVNNVFSSTYDNYKIILDITSVSSVSSPVIGLRLRASGSDYSTGNHAYGRFVVNQTGGSAGSGSTTFTYFVFGSIDDTAAGFNYEATIFNPNTTKAYKNFISHGVSDNNGPGVVYLDLVSGKVNTASAYDGFTILLSSAGTVTGSVSTYGFNK